MPLHLGHGPERPSGPAAAPPGAPAPGESPSAYTSHAEIAFLVARRGNFRRKVGGR